MTSGQTMASGNGNIYVTTFESEALNLMETAVEGAVAHICVACDSEAANTNMQIKCTCLMIIRMMANEVIRKICRLHLQVYSVMQNENIALNAKVERLELELKNEKEKVSPTHVVHNGIIFEIKPLAASQTPLMANPHTNTLTQTTSQSLEKQSSTQTIQTFVTKQAALHHVPAQTETTRIEPVPSLDTGRGPAEVADPLKVNEAGPGEKTKCFRCNICDKVFKAPHLLRSHKKHIHLMEKMFACDQCDRKFRVAASLENHLMRHEKQKTKAIKNRTCRVCEETLGSRLKLRHHERRAHPELKDAEERRFLCSTCGMSFTTQRILQNHLVVHTGEKRFACETCGKAFKQSTDLKVHKRTHTGERPFKCGECDKGFRTRYTLNLHKAVHTGEKKFRCDVCGSGFRFKSNLSRHRLIHTGLTPYNCKVCGKRFTQSTHLKDHMVCHGAPRPFMCELCGKTYLYQCLLQTHQKQAHYTKEDGEPFMPGHGNPREFKPFPCEMCHRGYMTEGALKYHKQIHSRPQYGCTLCGKAFHNKLNFQYHQLVHSGAKPYSCDDCGKKYRTMHLLNSHKLSHTGEKPHTCEHCGKAFRVRQNMMRHAKLHTGERSYECEVCSRKFSQKSHVQFHMQVHTGVRPFSCDTCGKGFSDSRQVKKHDCTNEFLKPLRRSSKQKK